MPEVECDEDKSLEILFVVFKQKNFLNKKSNTKQIKMMRTFFNNENYFQQELQDGLKYP